ncbi:RloB family protein [Phocaeicola plebeius]|uniref:RloB family protein n=1 Tax=Phocaeicola plebeius TaxID=310297 RepID=UPI0026F238BF|nr:RloB family protein [Phocaeicola plebeius]
MRKVYKKSHRSASLVRRQSMREVKQSFLIVCEGVRTEPDYFRAFRMTAAMVKAVGQAMNTTSLVSKAISIRDSEQKKKRTYDQCWVVFDKDDFPAKDFNDALALAERNGFRVAYSNQAFEYWFLLHFNLYKGTLHRNSYPDMLSRLMGIPYSKTEGFGAIMYNRLLHMQPQAIKNASAVLAEMSHGNPALEESSTTVHLLVEELNKYL